MPLSRRHFTTSAAAAFAAALAARDTSAQQATLPQVSGTPSTVPSHDHDMTAFPAHWNGQEKIAFLAYPKLTLLDLVGPHHMLGNMMGATTMIVAKSRDPVVSDMGMTIIPTTTLADCPADLDIICVPGGTEGTLAAMQDAETIAFLRDRGSRAKLVTSVCTGSMLLGAAGLLKGYKATSHWGTREVLRDFGAEPVDARVVVDRNRITGAGVTAGLDFGLTIVAMLRDETYAQSLQLLAEYDPSPPFSAGTLAKAPKAASEMMSAMLNPVAAMFKDAAIKSGGGR